MIAAQIAAYGGADAVVIKDIPSPVKKPGQLLVSVAAASINPFDRIIREGMMKDKIPLTFPFTPGGDFAGTVLEADSDTGIPVGTAVFGQAQVISGASGAFAEIATANAGSVARMPAKTTAHEAAALPLVGASAVQAIEEHMHLTKGQKILIHGGAGGIGHLAIQLAKYHGAFVATTASAADRDFVSSLGADQVIDFKTEQFEKVISGYDAVYDTIGGDVTVKSFTVLKKGGILVSMKGPPDPAMAASSGVTAIGQATKTDTERLTRVASLVDQGALKVHIARVFPLADIVNAWRFMETGHPQGKVVLTMTR
jgi:NADPH:quinone reductase-like Zn-dependent oxidoreductase